MELFLTILLLNVLQQLIPGAAKHLSKILNAVRYRGISFKEKQMRQQLTVLENEQKSINMMDEFAKHARLQRKIDKISTEIKSLVKTRASSYRMTMLSLHYSLKAILVAVMLYICVSRRSDPVVEVPEGWTSYFSVVFAFPAAEVGTVSCFFWMVVCRVSVAKISSFLFDFTQEDAARKL